MDSEGVLEEVLVEDGVASAGECRVEAAPVEVGSGSWPRTLALDVGLGRWPWKLALKVHC